MLTVEQAANQLGIKEGTLRLWLAQRKIPYVKLGRAVRIPEKAIEELIVRSTVPAHERRDSA